MKTYSGGCHCGAVRFEVEADISKAVSCNCSHCFKKGLLLTFVPTEHLHVLSGEENLTEYRFNKKVIAHLFCKTCGVQSFTRAELPDGRRMSSINVRCLDDFDVDSIPTEHVDGKSR